MRENPVLIAVLATAFIGERMTLRAGPSGSSWASPGSAGGSSGPPSRRTSTMPLNRPVNQNRCSRRVRRNSLTKSIAYGHGSWISQEAVGVAQHTFVGTDMFAGGVPGS